MKHLIFFSFKYILRPAKNEVANMRRTEEVMKQTEINNTKLLPLDKVVKHGGVILRTFDDHAEMRTESLNRTE